MDYFNGNMRGVPGTGGYVDINMTPQTENNGADMPAMPQQPYLFAPYQNPMQGYMPPDMPSADPLQQIQNSAAGTESPEMQQFMEQGYLMGPNCFGKDSQRYENQLLEYINDEYHDSLYYNALSRRATDPGVKRVFRQMASDEMRHARRWAAAYFLISGKRYFPERTSVPPLNIPPDFNMALRERYIAESRDAVKYRQFAASTNDRCLRRMATETSEDERQHAQDILNIIQNI